MSLLLFNSVEDAGGGGAVKPLPLHREGLSLLKSDGSYYKYHGLTAFTAPQDYANGEIGKLDDYFGWAVEQIGVNTVRVFCMWRNTGYSPRSVNSYYEKLEKFLEYAAGKGLYVHLVLFCDQVDGSPVKLSTEEQNFHARTCAEMARRGDNCLIEIINEDFKNGQISARFEPQIFTDVVSCRSAWFAGDDPESPGTYLDWTTHHLDRDKAEFPRKGKELVDSQILGLGNYPPARRPAIAGEPIRVAEGTTARQHADNAAVCELFGVGVCIHGGFAPDPRHESDLQRCNVPTGLSLECCRGYGDVWKAGIPASAASRGSYTRGPFSSCPLEHHDEWSLRTFAMLEGGTSTTVVVSPNNNHRVIWQDGWSLDRQVGPHGQILLGKR